MSSDYEGDTGMFELARVTCEEVAEEEVCGDVFYVDAVFGEEHHFSVGAESEAEAERLVRAYVASDLGNSPVVEVSHHPDSGGRVDHHLGG